MTAQSLHTVQCILEAGSVKREDKHSSVWQCLLPCMYQEHSHIIVAKPSHGFCFQTPAVSNAKTVNSVYKVIILIIMKTYIHKETIPLLPHSQ